MNDQALSRPELIEELSVLQRRIKELEESGAERKQADEALEEPEERFRGLVENVNDIFYEMDGRGILRYLSPSVERIFGYTQSETIGRSMTDFLAPEDTASAVKNMQNVMAGQMAPREYRVLLKSGGIGWIRVFSSPISKGNRVVG